MCSNDSSTVLKIYNSLTRSNEVFKPRDPNGRHVKWYSCGPTVYDASHMGHARSYISFDILRRILQNYFGYDVQYVMNITDIDDKIIKRARQEHLFKAYETKCKDLRTTLNDVTTAIEGYTEDTQNTTDVDKKALREKTLGKVHVALKDADKYHAKTSCDIDTANSIIKLLAASKEVLVEWLDKNLQPDVVFDNKIFADFAKIWEIEYFRDMDALGVMKPDVLTRVSEYVPEIVRFIQKIITNGFAYESDGSVYFDVQTFQSSPNHRYAKLVPEAVGDMKALQEGEGELSVKSTQKKSQADFALWKASKPGEPRWDSPWGPGRPGWHIECSVMASEITGSTLDIHSGGVDLKFPHHDNEIAQSEAYFQIDDWIKYFVHSGHLTIAGCKMSKSLKNFITIKTALDQYTPEQIRMTFLLHSWKDTLDYSPSGMETAIQLEKFIKEFFLNIKDCLRHSKDPYPKWHKPDLELYDLFKAAKLKVHESLCNNLDTRSSMFAIKDLIGSTNRYIQSSKSTSGADMNSSLLTAIAKYITDMLRIYGIVSTSANYGYHTSKENQSSFDDIESLVMPFVEVLSDFRDIVRSKVKNIEDVQIKVDILKECDIIRDERMPDLGVRLEDHEGARPIVKYVGREEMLREKMMKEKLAKEQEELKQRKKEEMLRLQEEKEAQKKIPPSKMFLNDIDKYSKFDENGMPTHDLEGNPLPKSQLKKLQKLQSQQKKKYDDYMKSLGENT